MRPAVVALTLIAISTSNVAAASGPPWRFAKAQGLEVVSDCDDYTTKGYLGSFFETLPLLGLPPEFRPAAGLPIEIILTQRPLDYALSPDDGPRGLQALRKIEHSVSIEIVEDSDLIVARVALRNWDSSTEVTGLPFALIPFFVAHHSPGPPAWILDGFSELYRKQGGTTGVVEDRLFLPGLRRTYEAVKDAAEYPERLLPFDLLFGRPAATLAGAMAERRKAELATFIRWALYDHDGARQREFWQFTTRSCTEPVTPELFRACFGSDYSATRRQLGRYISSALWVAIPMRMTNIPHVPPIEIRDATAAEFARIESDWERLEAVELRPEYAQLSQLYFETAGRTLASVGNAPGDARLLATRALFQLDAGRADDARRLLEEAAGVQVFRPRAYLELARLRFAEAKRQPHATDGKLDRQQTIAVLQPLFAARRQSPALADTYKLIADVWKASAVAPQADQLVVFDEGVRLFPHDTEVTFEAALFAAEHAFVQPAERFLSHAIEFAPSEEFRAQFNLLKSNLNRPAR
jgi:hypothetical protein